MATTPNFSATPKAWSARPTAANTDRDTANNTVTLVTAGANGARIDHLEITAIGNTTAGQIRFYVNTAGTSRLLFEVPVTVVTPNTSTTACWHWVANSARQGEILTYTTANSRFIMLPLLLEAGDTLSVGSQVVGTAPTDTFNVFAYGGEF